MNQFNDPTPERNRLTTTRYHFPESEATDVAQALQELCDRIGVTELESDTSFELESLATFEQQMRDARIEELKARFDPENPRHKQLLELGERMVEGFNKRLDERVEEARKQFDPEEARLSLIKTIQELHSTGTIKYSGPVGFRLELESAAGQLRRDGNFLLADRIEEIANNLQQFVL